MTDAQTETCTRPRTWGELRDQLRQGGRCEIAAHAAEMACILLRGWLEFNAFTVRPSSNLGWAVFEPTQ
jgi:hypothetical protein